MKKRIFSIVAVALLTIASVAFTSCEDDEDSYEKGKKAAREFCECLDDGNSISKCNEKFKDKYGSYASDDFKKGFNEEGKKCDIEVKDK